MIGIMVTLAALLWVFCIIYNAELNRLQAKPPTINVSVGYYCEYHPIQNPESEFKEWEAKNMRLVEQRNIQFHHLSIMPDGRMELKTNHGIYPCPNMPKLFHNGKWLNITEFRTEISKEKENG